MVKTNTLSGMLGLASVVASQQVYIETNGSTPRPNCPSCAQAQPQYSFTSFRYDSMTSTMRYATSRPSPTTTTTYASHSADLTTLLGSQSYTTWGRWDPLSNATATDTSNPYGNAAWTNLWVRANPPAFVNQSAAAIYSTTVSPTPVPTSELVLPPRDYFGPSDCYNFPEGFEFGVASSARQIEGAIANEGGAPCLLELLGSFFGAPPMAPKDYVTNENYYYYKQDIERVAAMGVKYYSFSIPWARILPFALPDTPVNQQAIDHYDDVINFILSKGMIPQITLLHFDTPLQFYGDNFTAGYTRPILGRSDGAYQNETFVDAYVNYAKIVMTHYADRVPVWYTFNEPLLYCTNGQSVYNVVKSHAHVYHFYKEELKGTGKISLKFNNNFGVPLNPLSEADLYAADHFNSIQLGPFANPIFLGTDYPESYKMTISDYVPLTQKDLAFFNGTADFLAIDPYTATVITPPEANSTDSILACAANSTSSSRPYCVNETTANQFGWNIGYRSQSYVYITPTYLRSYLNYLYNTWHHPVVITEFGFPVFAEDEKVLPDQLFDTPRSIYYLSFMSEVLKAIWEDGVEVLGAFAWYVLSMLTFTVRSANMCKRSFADNWEFGDYEQHFGIQTVNRTTQERHYKKSFFDLVDFMKARNVD